MQLTGPTKIVFPDANGQQPCAVSATGNVGAVNYSVTGVPSQVVSLRKTPTSPPLAVGAVLTSAEASALVATRSPNTGLGPLISRSAVTAVRTRVYATGGSAPAFTVGGSTDVTAVQNGNYFIPNFPTGGTGTLTVEMLFDTGTAITLGNISDLLMQLNYGNATSSSWPGVVAKAIISTDGVAVSVLSTLSGIADSGNPNSQEHFSGNVTGAPSARWFGIQLTLVPIVYPLILLNVGVNPLTSGAYTTLPTPVYFSIQGTDSGAGGVSISRTAVTAVRTRVYATGGSAPAFTVGGSTDVTAVQNGNYFIPNFPTGGTGTLTVEILFDTGTAITLGKVSDLLMQLNYGNATSSSWPGVVAKAIASTDGVAVTVLSTLSGVADSGNPNSQEHFSGNVTGAPSARWFGIQLTLVPIVYPLLLLNVGLTTAGASTATLTVPIGDTTTNFGPPPPIIVVSGNSITRLGSTETLKALGISITGGTAPYTISVNAQGVVSPLALVKTAAGTPITGNAAPLTLSELQNLMVRRTTHTAYVPGSPVDYTQAVSIRSESSGVTTLLDSSFLTAFKDLNLFGQGGGAGLTSSGFLVEMPTAIQVGSITNIPLRYGYGEVVPAGTTIQFLTSTNGTTLVVAATIALPSQGSDGNYTTSATIAGAANAKFWGLRFKFPAATSSSGIGFYGGAPALATPSTPYQVPDTISSPSVFIISVQDSVSHTASGTFRAGGSDTVIVEAPASSDPAFVELQELVGNVWTSRGTLALTGRIGDISPDSGMKFEGTVGSVWVTDPASTLPVLGSFEAWGVRFGWGSGGGRKFGYCFGLKPTASAWPTYPFGDVTTNSRQTVPSQLHRWVVKTPTGAVMETLDWNGGPINDPAKSPKQFWVTDANGNLTTPGLRPYHVGQAIIGWTAAPNVRASAANIFPKMDPALEWPFRDPGVTNPLDYTMVTYQTLGLFNIYAMEADGIATTQFGWSSEDPEMITGTDRHISSTTYGYRYRAGQTSGRDVTTGPGGTRAVDRCIMGDPFAQVVQSPTSVRLHRNTPWVNIGREVLKSHFSENCFHISNARLPKTVTLSGPGGTPSYSRFYYGGGYVGDPLSIDLNSGQASDINGANDSPSRPGHYALSKTDPSGWLYWSGQVPDSEHNYPFAAVGALLFESPAHWWAAQFHFLQSSMVMNRTGYLTSFPGSWTLRTNAWPWASAAYLWAIQDSNHAMSVISRANLEAQLKADLIRINDQEIPYINTNPANVDTVEDYNRALMKRFGGIGSSFTKIPGPSLLPLGYLCQALQLWKKFGLWDRMRSLDSRCATGLDYVLGQIAKGTVDLLLDAPYILTLQADPSYHLPTYNPQPWPTSDPPAGTSPSSLQQSWASWAVSNPANGATFWQDTSGRYIYGIGQYHVLHCVTALKRVFASTYPRIDAAETAARQLMSSRIAAIRTLPTGQKAAHLATMEVYQNLVASSETGAVTTF